MEKQSIPQYAENNGNLVHYKWNSILTVHNRPEKLIQTIEKKTYSEAFGTSRRAGKSLGELLNPVLPDSSGKELQQSIDIALYQWLLTNPLQNASPVNEVPFLTGLQFNEEYTLSEMSKIAIAVTRNADNTIELTIPSFNPVNDIVAPMRTESFTFKIMAVACRMVDGAKLGGHITELTIPYNDEQINAQTIKLPLSVEQGDLSVVALSVEYTIMKEVELQVVHNQRWRPSGVIWTGYN